MSKNAADLIIDLMHEIHRIMRRRMTSFEREYGINFQQLFGLMILAEHEGMTMKELATQLHVTSPTATFFVNRLVRLGWVKRHADRANRKLVRLRLTPKGRALLHKVVRARRAMIEKIVAALSVRDQREYARILTIIVHTLQD